MDVENCDLAFLPLGGTGEIGMNRTSIVMASPERNIGSRWIAASALAVASTPKSTS